MIGCHGLVWSGSFGREGMALAVERTEEAGFGILEVPPASVLCWRNWLPYGPRCL